MPESDRLVDAPLMEAEGEVTPGWDQLYVVDTTTMLVITDATKVDCDAGICWRWAIHRSHPYSGSYKIMCPPETLAQYGEQWKQSW